MINHRARGADVIALGAVTAAAILTKATSYALVAPVALAVLLRLAAPSARTSAAAALKRRRRRRRRCCARPCSAGWLSPRRWAA